MRFGAAGALSPARTAGVAGEPSHREPRRSVRRQPAGQQGLRDAPPPTVTSATPSPAGYFTSRPTSKGYIRAASAFLQAARQLQVLADLPAAEGAQTADLEWAVAIAQVWGVGGRGGGCGRGERWR